MWPMRMVAVLLCAMVWLGAGIARADEADPWFGLDKVQHFAAGTVLGAGGYGAAALASDSTRTRIVVGLGAALGAGAAKELYDRAGHGDASWRDFAWDG